MLIHAHEKPAAPKRAVVIGAGGFVGGAILKEIRKAKIPVLGITRTEADLLSPGGADALKALLHLASPALPIGAFSYSQGLEAAIEALASAGPCIFGLTMWIEPARLLPYLPRPATSCAPS